MLLYHGTNGAWVNNIMRKGLEPRGSSQIRNNWKHVAHQSNRNAVYLTDSYAPYFAFNASRGSKPLCAVVEVDTDKLDQDKFFPDEDYLEQVGRRIDHVKGTMSQRTLHYRKVACGDHGIISKRTMRFADWRDSLAGLGTCAYYGVVPPQAITRIVSWPVTGNGFMCFVWDPTITLINQKIMGDRYRALTAKLFGDEPTIEMSEFDRRGIDHFNAERIIGYRKIEVQNIQVKVA